MLLFGALLFGINEFLSHAYGQDIVAMSIAVVTNVFGIIFICLGLFRIIKKSFIYWSLQLQKSTEVVKNQGEDTGREKIPNQSLYKNQEIMTQNMTAERLHKGVLLIASSTLFIFGILFYWYEIRPSNIKKECSMVALKTYSQEQKRSAFIYANKNCPSETTTDCRTSEAILEAPLDSQMQKRPVSEMEYKQCLRENGI